MHFVAFWATAKTEHGAMVFDEKQKDSNMKSQESLVGEGTSLPKEPSAAGLDSGQQRQLTGTKLYLI
jgi:hypothetical protein